MPSRAAGASRATRVIPACDGARRSISSQSSAALDTPSPAPRRSASSAATIQSGQHCPGATSFWASRVTRPSMLVVVPVRSWAMATGSTTSARAADDERKPSTATTKPARPRASSARARSGKSPTGSEPTSTTAVIDPSAKARSMPSASRPRAAGPRPPRRFVPAPTFVEATPAREQPGGEAHVEGPHHVAPAQRGEKARLRPRLGHGRGGVGHERPVFGQRRPSDDHDDTLAALAGVRQGAEGARPRRRRRPSRDARHRHRPGRGPAVAASPGRYGSTAVANSLRAPARGASSTTGTSPSIGRPPEPQEQDRQFFAQVPRQHDHTRRRAGFVDGGPGQAEDDFGRAGRHRAGRRPSRSRSPTWRAWPRRRRPRWRAGPHRARRSPRDPGRPGSGPDARPRP